jgi:LNS2 (Lipin/Ned1/Smp2)
MLAGCNAYDLILVVQNNNKDDHPAAACSDCMFRFGALGCTIAPDSGMAVYFVVVDPATGGALRFPVVNNTIQAPETSTRGRSNSQAAVDQDNDKHDASALTHLASCLRPGSNTARFLLVDNNNTNSNGEIVGIAPMHIYLWNALDKIVVVDVDGTITKSTLLGFWNTAVRRNYSHVSCHDGVCEFLTSIPNVRCIYLTNRPITYAEPTRGFLTELRQGENRLPEGPLIGFTGGLAGVFKVRTKRCMVDPSSTWCDRGRFFLHMLHFAILLLIRVQRSIIDGLLPRQCSRVQI